MSTDWLSQLAPAHAPPAPGWWPLAPGWWAAAGVALAAAAGLAWWWRRDPYRLRRRLALRELKRIEAADAEAPALAQAVENLLRRFAIAVFGTDRVARLGGEAWLVFVGSEGGELLAGDAGRSLLAAAFGGRVRDERERWLKGAAAFVRAAARNEPARKSA